MQRSTIAAFIIVRPGKEIVDCDQRTLRYRSKTGTDHGLFKSLVGVFIDSPEHQETVVCPQLMLKYTHWEATLCIYNKHNRDGNRDACFRCQIQRFRQE